MAKLPKGLLLATEFDGATDEFPHFSLIGAFGHQRFDTRFEVGCEAFVDDGRSRFARFG
jgi:hypothetical protein